MLAEKTFMLSEPDMMAYVVSMTVNVHLALTLPRSFTTTAVVP